MKKIFFALILIFTISLTTQASEIITNNSEKTEIGKSNIVDLQSIIETQSECNLDYTIKAVLCTKKSTKLTDDLGNTHTYTYGCVTVNGVLYSYEYHPEYFDIRGTHPPKYTQWKNPNCSCN